MEQLVQTFMVATLVVALMDGKDLTVPSTQMTAFQMMGVPNASMVECVLTKWENLIAIVHQGKQVNSLGQHVKF